ncbi:MAG: DUF1413 domain-containing protein [Clostridiales bacterium]|nr:DUF1413 domain-containing protein [Clostridiales bacterium]
MSDDELIVQARKNIAKMKVNIPFTLRELMGATWLSLSKGERIRFGKNFKALVVAGEFDNIIYINKKANNSASYRKER